MPRQQIHAYATEIQIRYVLHFTRAENLPSIMNHGLYPIGRIGEIGANPKVNDAYRWDGYRNGTSVSIGFPNCRMLYKCRKDYPEADWAILVINPSVLVEKNCAFCCHNAADKRISSQPLAELMTVPAFRGMYDEIEGLASRGEQRLKPWDPTDEQAEVLVFDVIEPQKIDGVIFQRASVKELYAQSLGSRKTYVHGDKGMFSSRGYARKYM